MSKVLDLRIKNNNFVYGTDKKGYNKIPEMYVSLFNSYLETVVDTKVDKELAEKDRQIAKLKEQLSNAIVPKFKVGQEIFWVYREDIITFTPKAIVKIEDEEEFIYCYDTHFNIQAKEGELFTTREEAEKALSKMKENKNAD